MAEEELQVAELRDDFYRDRFGKVVGIITSLLIAIVLLIALSIYLHISKPKPVYFAVDEDWRIQPAIPLDQPYISTPDLLQWVSEVIPRSFHYDFVHYNDQLSHVSKYFTSDGWKVFLNQLNIYVNYNNVQTNKQFVNASPAGAPYIINQGLLSGKYGWWVQMPITIDYTGNNNIPSKDLTLQILVVRVPTLNNLLGVGIDNVIVVNGSGDNDNGNNNQTQTQGTG